MVDSGFPDEVLPLLLFSLSLYIFFSLSSLYLIETVKLMVMGDRLGSSLSSFFSLTISLSPSLSFSLFSHCLFSLSSLYLTITEWMTRWGMASSGFPLTLFSFFDNGRRV